MIPSSKRFAVSVFLASLIAVSACEAGRTQRHRPPRTSGRKALAASTVQSSRPEPLEFVERCLGASCDAELPTLLLIHGLGDRPESFLELYDELAVPVRIVALRAPLVWLDGFAWFPYRSRSTTPEVIGDALAPLVPRIVATIDQLCAIRRCRGEAVVSGFSQGGMATFAIVALAPDRVRAAFPIAGFLSPNLEVVPSEDRPVVVAFHGAGDDVVSPELDRIGVERLRLAGYDARLRLEARVQHAVGPAIRAELLPLIASALRQ